MWWERRLRTSWRERHEDLERKRFCGEGMKGLGSVLGLGFLGSGFGVLPGSWGWERKGFLESLEEEGVVEGCCLEAEAMAGSGRRTD